MFTSFNTEVVQGEHILKEHVSKIPGKKITILTSRTPHTLFGDAVADPRFRVVFVDNNQLIYLERLARQHDIGLSDYIVGMGSGTVIDAAKTISCMTDKRVVCIPTILTCNAFATNKSVVSDNGVVRTIDTKIPEKVIIDYEVIRTSARRYSLSGIADVISIHTACFDWDLAVRREKESPNRLIRNMAQSLLETTLTEHDAILDLDNKGLYTLSQSLLMAGYLTNMFGSGRPESGSEHMFARAVEEEGTYHKKLLHGELVMLGILLCSKLQNQEHETIGHIAQRMNLPEAFRHAELHEGAISRYLVAASTIRPERYSIFNEKPLAPEIAAAVVKETIAQIRL